MRVLVICLMAMISTSCTENKKYNIDKTPFQKKMNSEFKDASISPLKSKDLKEFKSLDFFKYDTTFVVKASLKRTIDTTWFNMKTTTDRVSKERIFGVLSFELKGKMFELNVYQGEESIQTEGFEDYLFLPFLDNTNGTSTYAGGRYIDLRIPEGNTIEIDFNSAYNPYCAYNEKFSCPIVPRVNYIDLNVEVGVKDFKKL